MVLFSFFCVPANQSTGRGKLPLVFRCIRYAPGIGSPGRQEPGPGTQIAPDFFCIQRHEYHTTYVPVPEHANRLLRNQDTSFLHRTLHCIYPFRISWWSGSPRGSLGWSKFDGLRIPRCRQEQQTCHGEQ